MKEYIIVTQKMIDELVEIAKEAGIKGYKPPYKIGDKISHIHIIK